MVSNFITRVVFYVTTFLRGELGSCHHCGKVTQVLPFGEQMRLHWKAMGARPKIIPQEREHELLCMGCDYDVACILGMHETCCEERMGAWAK